MIDQETITGPGVYLTVNGTEALVTAWVPLDWHTDGGHWIGMVDPRIYTQAYPGDAVHSYSPFNSWHKDGRDCDGYSAWNIATKLEEV